MIVVIAALKGGVGKTTTSVYPGGLAVAGAGRPLIDADPQASAADWLENSEDEHLEWVSLVEAPTERLLTKALDRIKGDDDIAIVDTPPGHEQLLAKALDRADAVVLPTRVGGVETPRVEAVLEMVPRKVPVGLVICSARTYTRLPGRRRRVARGRCPGVGQRPRAGRDRGRAGWLALARWPRRVPRGVAPGDASGA